MSTHIVAYLSTRPCCVWPRGGSQRGEVGQSHPRGRGLSVSDRVGGDTIWCMGGARAGRLGRLDWGCLGWGYFLLLDLKIYMAELVNPHLMGMALRHWLTLCLFVFNSANAAVLT